MKGLLIAGTGAAAYGYYEFLKTQSNKLLWEVRGSIFSIKAEGVKIKLDVTLKNPTTTNFNFSFPFLTLGLNDTDVLASSQVDGSIVELNGGTQKPLEPIWIVLPLSALVRLGLAALKAITDGKQGLVLVVKAATNAQLFFGTVSHEIPTLRKDITIFKPK